MRVVVVGECVGEEDDRRTVVADRCRSLLEPAVERLIGEWRQTTMATDADQPFGEPGDEWQRQCAVRQRCNPTAEFVDGANVAEQS